uniref:Myb2 n=1 Tax=Arundo donax TaxID=35708 RepID=A0A0A9CXE6_ARUDO
MCFHKILKRFVFMPHGHTKILNLLLNHRTSLF